MKPGKQYKMSGFGGMLSFQVKGGKDSAMSLAAHVDAWRRYPG